MDGIAGAKMQGSLIDRFYLPRRVSSTGDGATDSVATAWFIWGKAERLAPAFVYPTVDVQQMALAI